MRHKPNVEELLPAVSVSSVPDLDFDEAELSDQEDGSEQKSLLGEVRQLPSVSVFFFALTVPSFWLAPWGLPWLSGDLGVTRQKEEGFAGEKLGHLRFLHSLFGFFSTSFLDFLCLCHGPFLCFMII